MKKNYRKQILKGALCFLLTAAFSLNYANAQVSLTASSGTTTGTYTTLSDAFAAINAGTHKGSIVINITNNTTEPSSVTPLYGSGTASASSSSYTDVLIKPSGGSWTINSPSTPTSNRALVELAGADNVTIDGDPTSSGTRKLTIANAPSTVSCAVVRVSSNSTSGTDGASNVTIKNCIILGSRNGSTSTTIDYGIVFNNYSTTSLTTGAYNNSNNVIENNEIRRTYRGIYHIGSSSTYPNLGLRIRNNIIGSSTLGENVGQYGVYCTYTSVTTSTTNSAIIEGNDIQVGDYATGYSTTVYGIYLSSYNYGMIIRRNNIHDIAQSASSGWGAHGIYFASTLNNDIKIENNFIRDITANSYSSSLSTFQNHGIYVSSVGSGTIVNHNTIYLNKSNATSAGVSNPNSSCIAFGSSSYSFSQFYNNILINNQGGVSSNAYCMYTSGTANLPATTNNNNYYCPSSGKIGYYSGAAIATFASWQSTTGLDASSISENVGFTSATDLHISTGTTTLCESGGVSTSTSGVTVDIDNTTRPGISTYGFGTAPDIGADEFNGQVTYTCTTPAPGATIATTLPICLGNSVTLSLTTATAGTGVSYQWQSSPDGVAAYTDITGATTATLVTTPTGTTFYRCKVTCKNGPVSTNSTPVQITFTNNVLSTTPNLRCGTGTVNLAATSSAGSTLQWYSGATGGVALGSGSPFTTPSIPTTTTYYVSAEQSSSGSATVGSGTSTANSSSGQTPFSLFYTSAHTQYLILASDISAAGFGPGALTSLSFNVTSKASSKAYSNYTIKLAHSSATSLTGLLTPTFTTVYGPATYNSVAGANTFGIGSSFSWDGSSNVLVDVCFDNVTPATGYSSNDAVSFVPKSYTATYGMYSDPTNLCGATTGGSTTSVNAIPLITFNGTIVCSSPRIPVIATVNTPPAFAIAGTQTVCNNAPAMMNVTSSLASFNTYVWTPSTGLYTDAACTVPYVAGASASTVYAKTTTAGSVTYTCTANNTSTLCANTANVTVTTLPSSVTVVATPANMCGSGSTTLAISPSTSTFGAGTWQWQSSANNITFADSTGMTGTTLTTPTLTFRRYYRITLKDGAGSVCLNSSSDTALVLIPAITSVTGAARCSTGTVTLGATGVDGTINWYAAASGGSSLATGTSYTTPSLTTTTTYYVGVIATPNVTSAVGTGTLSNSTTTYPTPFGNYWGSSHDQYLITAAELTAAGFSAGTFSSIAFDLSSAYGSAALSNFKIMMAPTTATAMSTTLISSGFTTVVPSTTYTPPAATGYATIPFTNNFTWNGTSNIVVDVSFVNCSSCTGTSSCTTSYTDNGTVKQTSTSYVSAVSYYYDDNCTINTFTPSGSYISGTYSQRPNMRFVQSGCETGTRTPVTATINTIPTVTATATPAVVCAGYSTTLTGGGTPSGTTYTWTGGVTDGVAFIPSATATYTVTGTNPVGGCQATANVTVTVNPTPTVTTAPLGTYTVCADSGVMLRGTYSSPGLTFQWYNGTTLVPGATADSLLAGGASGGSGVYTLKVNLGSCSAQSTPGTTMIVNPVPTPSVSPSGTLNVCSAVPTVLTGTGSGDYQWYDASGPISGATGTTYTVPVTGVYKLLLTNPTTGCRKLTPAINVNITPTPTVSISPTLSKVCIDSFAALTSVHSAGFGTGNTYQWYNGTTPIPAPAGTVDYYTHTTSGVYTLKVTNNGLCSTTSNTATVIVNPLPASSFTKTGTTGAICLGSTMELTALAVPTGSKYQWMLNGVDISGANGQKYYAPVGGVYSVRIIDSNNCRKISDTLSLINTPMGVPIPSPLTARFCEGDIMKIYANAGPYAASFKWTKNGSPLPDTTSLIITGASGTFVVKVTDIYGCDATSPNVTITVDPIPTKPIISKSGMVLTTTTPYSSYQWYRNGKAIPSATFRSYTMLFDGNYHVVVTNSANCSNVSDIMSIQGLSVKQISSNSISVAVYPNPSQSVVNIDAPVEVNLYVKDIQGKQILELKNAKQVDLAAYADGIYIFTITDKEGMVLKMDKVVKKTN